MKVEEIIEKYRKAINKVYTQEEIDDIINLYPECEHALINLMPLLNIHPECNKPEDLIEMIVPHDPDKLTKHRH